MFYNDEEKRKRQMMGLEPNGWSNNTNQNPLPSAKPMEEMTTREALETAWNKQFPYGGHKTMTGQLGDFSYYDENLNKPKEPFGQTPVPYQAVGNRFAQHEQKFSSPLSNGFKDLNLQDWGGIVTDSALAVERLANERTNGKYAEMSPQIGTNYQQRYDNDHRLADEAGVGDIGRFVDSALDAGNKIIEYASPKNILKNPLSLMSLKTDLIGKSLESIQNNLRNNPSYDYKPHQAIQTPIQESISTPTPWGSNSQQTSTPLNQHDDWWSLRKKRMGWS